MTVGIKITWIFLCLFILLIFTACSGLTPGITGITTTPTVTTTTTAAAVTSASSNSIGNQAVNYQLLLEVPPAVQSKLQTFKKSRGYLYITDEKILVIFMGERSTGGYSIQVKKIDKAGETLIIQTAEKSPKPGDVVTQAFTYPMLILHFQDSFTAFLIKDSTGAAYVKLEGVQY